MKAFFVLTSIVVFSFSGFAQKKTTKKLPAKIPSISTEKEAPLVAPDAAGVEIESTYTTPESPKIVSDGSFSNFHMNTIPLLIGAVDAGWDFKVYENFLLGPQVQVLNFKISGVEFANSGAGVRGTLTLWPALTSGPHVSLGLGQTKVSASFEINNARATSTTTSLYYFIGAGYSWFWDHFNLTAGASFGGNSVRNIEILDINQNLVKSASVPAYPMVQMELGFSL